MSVLGTKRDRQDLAHTEESVAPGGMTPTEKAAIVEILERAHGYALMGSIVAFRLACEECGGRGTKAAMLAGLAIEKAKFERGISGKPARSDYPEIIEAALQYIQTGALPETSTSCG